MPEEIGQHQAISEVKPESPVSLSGLETENEEDLRPRSFPILILSAMAPDLAVWFQATGGGRNSPRVRLRRNPAQRLSVAR